MKRALCFLLTISIVLCFVGCNNVISQYSSSDIVVESTPSQPQTLSEISLLYSYSDSFNPYTAKTALNKELASLLFDSLVKTDNDFNARLILAESAQTEDKICTVKIRNANFTDGSPVTADDVVYSYKLAKESPRYMHNFYEVASVSAIDSKTIVFKLAQHDEYFINLLNFPILKSGTSGVTDSDGKEVYPVGCGRYFISEGGSSLELNQNYYGTKGKIKTIKLINSPDSSSTTHYVEIGATQMYYTDSDDIVRMSGKKASVNLNRLVYIGINSSYGSLQTKQMRYAISSALDREKICQTAYYNNAEPAKGFFNPYFEPTQALQTIESKPNLKITVENLSKIGYNNLNASGFYSNTSGNNPVFTLLVNSENYSRVAAANAIAAQCQSAGIQINVVKCTYAQYLERLSNGGFQLYLGEVQLLNNMDLTQLVTQGGSAAYGVGYLPESTTPPDTTSDTTALAPPADPCKTVLDSYHAAQCSIADVAGTLLTEMPQIPVCYLNGVLFYDSDIKGGVEASNSDIYLGFENYEF